MSWVDILRGVLLCAVAGVSGAVAAVFGKLAGLPDVELPFRIAFYVLLIACNGLMLILYTRSLRFNTSLASTAATTAVNISATGWLGKLVFGEANTMQWWIGAITIFAGSILINRSQKQEGGEVPVKVPGAREMWAKLEKEAEEEEEQAAAAGATATAKPAAKRRTRRAVAGVLGGQEQQQQQQGQKQTCDRYQVQQQQPDQHQEADERQQQQQDGKLYNYAVLLQYDGTRYAGFQLQSGPAAAHGGRRAKPTIQQELEAALCKVTREPREVLKVQAAGRTDAGVHARGQVAQFLCHRPLEASAVARALNALLPPDIRAPAVHVVPLDFNVRYALGKTYTYDIHLAPVADAFLHRWRHHPRHPSRLRLEAMADAAQLFVGTHNYSMFANVSPDGARKNPVKNIARYQLLPIPDGARLEVEGSGFLYKQVRHMTGALLAVGAGLLGADDIGAALEAGERVRTGAERHAYRGWQVAEAKGLCLHRVRYPPRSDVSTRIALDDFHSTLGFH